MIGDYQWWNYPRFAGSYCRQCGAYIASGTSHWCTTPVAPLTFTVTTTPCTGCAENLKRIEALERRLKALADALAAPRIPEKEDETP